MEKIIIIRTGNHGEEIQRVLKIKNFNNWCMDVINNAAKEWNSLPADAINCSYREQINRALSRNGYEFEDVAYEIFEDWDES